MNIDTGLVVAFLAGFCLFLVWSTSLIEDTPEQLPAAECQTAVIEGI
jgi:hypothetical protein